MSKNKPYQSKQTPGKRSKLPIFFLVGGVAILAISLFFALRKPAAPYVPEVTGNPSIQVDKEKVDLGNMKLGNTAQVSFEVKNVGDQPLRFTEAPYIEVKEGC